MWNAVTNIFVLIVVILLSTATAVQAINLDNGKCVDYYVIYNNKCDLAIEKINISNQFDDCNDAGVPDAFKTEIEPKIDKILTSYYSNNKKPTTDECVQMHSVFYAHSSGIYNSGGTDLQKCMQELMLCANLFQSCQANTGSIKMNDLEDQCKGFLTGKSWNDLAGTNLCSNATKLEGTIQQQCNKYKADLKKAKEDVGISTKPPAQYDGIPLDLDKIQGLGNRINKIQDKSVQSLTGRILKTAMGIMGSIALVMIMYGGVLWMVAGGNSDKAHKSLQIIIWSALGIAVIFASYAIVDMVFGIFT